MQVVSYRGPGKAGGVSPALTRLLADKTMDHMWWHIDDNIIRYATQVDEEAIPLRRVSKGIVEGHYRYCNEFLWPIMHDLSEYALYRPEDRAIYERFNRILAKEIISKRVSEEMFVQDYQLALLPQELSKRMGPDTGVFWHIPWPKSVPALFVPAIVDIAKGLLSARFLGFHTDEYAKNFLQFVEENIPGTICSASNMTVTRDLTTFRVAHDIHSWSGTDYRPLTLSTQRGRTTKIITAPLGLDVNHWQKMSRLQLNTRLHPALIKTNFVLSVDRADYTKGVLNRLDAVDSFFSRYPELKENVTFAQLCTRSREGLPAFDRYWRDCQDQIQSVNAKYSTNSWSPVLSLNGPLDPAQLALLYSNAAVMLVNPVRDGLNLTAKEFIACQRDNAGALALSPHAGAWEELGQWSVPVDPFDADSMSRSIHNSLTLTVSEKHERAAHMLDRLKQNTMHDWCVRFGNLLGTKVQRSKDVMSV